MKRFLSLLLCCMLLAGTALADGWWYHDGVYRDNTYSNPWRTTLKMRLSTRTGPGTHYDELGSYHKQGYELTVLSRAYDDRNGIWWVQVEFGYGDTIRRAYTGLKRVNIDVNRLQEDMPQYFATVTSRTIPYTGPGIQYHPYKNALRVGTEGVIYAFENGWVQLEFYDQGKSLDRRVWLPENCVSWSTHVTY